MTEPLWKLADIVAATGAHVDTPSPHRLRLDGERVGVRGGNEDGPLPGAAPHPDPLPAKQLGEGISGISIDTRTLKPGDLFVALKDVRDGHDFVALAFERGAAAALVRRDYDAGNTDPRLLRVDYSADGIAPDEAPLEALRRLGSVARARLSPEARVIAVTGSAGKTTTKEMLRACLTPLGKTHASEKSYNNHWGVPLTLARMPAETEYAVFEIGMNHAGEIALLSPMVRPHVAIITTIAPAHLGNFKDVSEIADAKAEIFLGLAAGDTAILPRENQYFDLLESRAKERSVRCISFGSVTGSDVILILLIPNPSRSVIKLQIPTRNPDGNNAPSIIQYELRQVGQHNADNSLAVVAALFTVLQPTTLPSSLKRIRDALRPLSTLGPVDGRGRRTTVSVPKLIADGPSSLDIFDESYNANPASVRAALGILLLNNPAQWLNANGKPMIGRRIAVLGDMLELGEQSTELHRDLVAPIEQAGVDLVFACGPLMRHLYDALPAEKRAKDGWALTARELEAPLLATVKGGDVVMIKGSNGMKLSTLVDALKKSHSARLSDGCGST